MEARTKERRRAAAIAALVELALLAAIAVAAWAIVNRSV